MSQYESIKIVKSSGNGGHIILPINLVGKKVYVLEI